MIRIVEIVVTISSCIYLILCPIIRTLEPPDNLQDKHTLENYKYKVLAFYLKQ